jgi:alpha-N-acetylglucosaminidase
VAAQWLGDLNALQLQKVAAAYKAKDKAAFAKDRDVFLQMLRDLDALQATRHETTLAKWIDDAVAWAKNDEQRRHYEWNARTQVTLWGPADGMLHDYARKNWSGLISTFYAPRWEKFFARLEETWDGTFDATAFDREMRTWEEQWTHGPSLPPAPAGDTVEVARKLFKLYAS